MNRILTFIFTIAIIGMSGCWVVNNQNTNSNYPVVQTVVSVATNSSTDILTTATNIVPEDKINTSTNVETAIEDVIVTAPLAQAEIGDGFKVEGKAKGNWFFEGSFPIKLLDADGTVLTQTPATAV